MGNVEALVLVVIIRLHVEVLLRFRRSKQETDETSYKYHDHCGMEDCSAQIVLHSLGHDARIRFTEENFFSRKEDKVMSPPFAGLEFYKKKVFQE